MTELQKILTELKDVSLNNITFKKIKESFNDLNHNPNEEIDLEYCELFTKCIEVCINVINGKNTSSEDKAKTNDILRSFLSLKFSDGSTLLHVSIKKENLVIIKFLIDKSSAEQLNAKDKYGKTPLHYALSYQYIVELLIQEKVCVNAKDEDGNTPLHLAVESGLKSIVELLINSGANVNDKNISGHTALHWSIYNGNPKVVELLINSGANVNIADKLGETPLHWAIEKGFDNVIKLLINSDANVNAKEIYRRNPLHYAVRRGKLKTVKLLIAKGVNVNAEDEFGQTPLYYAAYNRNYDVIDLLISDGTTIIFGDKKGKNALDYVKSLDDEKYPIKQIILPLLEKKLSKYQAKNACYATTILSTITATTLFTTGKIAYTLPYILLAADIIVFSTLIISYLTYGIALNYYSTPNPRLENSKTAQNSVAQVASAA